MIFLCFSGKDRQTIVNSIRYHLESYGLTVWYDNHQYIIGDNKIVNYTQAINSSSYAVIILSKYFFNSPGAIEEIEVIYEKFKKKEMFIFPIFYKISAGEIPKQFQWLCELIYNELDERTGSLLTANQILSKYLKDSLKKFEFQKLEQWFKYSSKEKANQSVLHFISDILTSYFEIGNANINARIAVLHSLNLMLFRYLDNLSCAAKILKILRRSSCYIFNSYKLNLHIDFKEIIIFEDITLLLLNLIFVSHQSVSE